MTKLYVKNGKMLVINGKLRQCCCEPPTNACEWRNFVNGNLDKHLQWLSSGYSGWPNWKDDTTPILSSMQNLPIAGYYERWTDGNQSYTSSAAALCGYVRTTDNCNNMSADIVVDWRIHQFTDTGMISVAYGMYDTDPGIVLPDNLPTKLGVFTDTGDPAILSVTLSSPKKYILFGFYDNRSDHGHNIDNSDYVDNHGNSNIWPF